VSPTWHSSRRRRQPEVDRVRREILFFKPNQIIKQTKQTVLNRRDKDMNRVTHFEIYTDDPEVVQPFYKDVFGWKFNKFEGGPIEYWLVTTGDDKDPGINGGITRPREGQSPGTINTVAVQSLDQTIKKVEQCGGKICVPKMAIPTVGWLAYAEDPAGNVFGIIEPDTNAR